MLEAKNISYAAGEKLLLQECSLSFAPGQLHVVMGPNGAGKSTLLQLLAGELKPRSGTVLLNGADIRNIPRRQLAQSRAVLSQQYAIQFPMTVSEVVRLGRYPHAGSLPAADEDRMVQECLAVLQMEGFSERDYGTLSGGEAQKVQMSRVLAQLGGKQTSGKLLFLDEPVSHLDIRYQHLLLQTAKDLCHRNNTVVAVLHDLNLALRFADRILFLKEGSVRHCFDDPSEISEHTIGDIFDLGAKRFVDGDGRPVFVF